MLATESECGQVVAQVENVDGLGFLDDLENFTGAGYRHGARYRRIDHQGFDLYPQLRPTRMPVDEVDDRVAGSLRYRRRGLDLVRRPLDEHPLVVVDARIGEALYGFPELRGLRFA